MLLNPIHRLGTIFAFTPTLHERILSYNLANSIYKVYKLSSCPMTKKLYIYVVLIIFRYE